MAAVRSARSIRQVARLRSAGKNWENTSRTRTAAFFATRRCGEVPYTPCQDDCQAALVMIETLASQRSAGTSSAPIQAPLLVNDFLSVASGPKYVWLRNSST